MREVILLAIAALVMLLLVFGGCDDVDWDVSEDARRREWER